MALEQRLESLEHRHATLKEAVRLEAIAPAPDDTRLHDLKVQKLRLKDEMAALAANADTRH